MKFRANTFVIHRITLSEFTFAIVRTRSKEPQTRLEVFESLKKALAVWQKTPAGERAWEASSKDFNVGDLNFHQGDDELIKALKDQGIEYLEVELHSEEDYPKDWTYDTVLMKERE